MKKIFAFCLATAMLLSLAACGQDVPKGDETGGSSSQQVGEPNINGNPEHGGDKDIAPEDDPGAKSSQQIAEQGQANLPEEDSKTDTPDSLDTADWKGVPENATGMPDIAPEDDPNAGTNQQVAQHFIVDLSEEDGSELQSVSDTASYAGAMAGDGYIQFGDKLAEKKALSQETIEWLTWYNSLSTDEQAAISTVPADLMVASGIAKSGDSEALGTELEEKLP